MKLRKTLSKISLLLFACVTLTVTSFAATSESMGIAKYRKPNAQNAQYAYAFGGNKIIFDLVKYHNGDLANPDYDHSLYCLKAETGFFAEMINGDYQPVDYDLSYDFKNKDGMPTLPVPETYYNQILWILDNIYMPTSETAETDKANLLKAAGITNSELTDDDIDVVQQMALWFFTNAEDPATKDQYHIISNGKPVLPALQISEKLNGVTGEFGALDDVSTYRDDQTKMLYEYFINTANANAATYNPGTVVPPVSLNKQVPTIELVGDNYIAGPYKINKDSDVPFTLEYTEDGNTYKTGFVNENGEELTGYTLLDETKNPIVDKTLEELVGTNFYISVPKTSGVKKIGFKLYAQYKVATTTYWTKGGNTTVQPIVEVKKEPENIIDENIATVPAEKEFDLALRKFISSVGNGILNRAPNPDVSKLASGEETSATYIHPKVPVTVKKGDIITYTIRVYNEGEIDGYVEEVTDFLPPELEYLVDDADNAKYRWTIVPGTNSRKITTDYLSKAREKVAGENLIPAFDGTTLEYKDLQVKCKVKDTAGKDKITNIAAITNDADENGNDVIDRDSDPSKVPTPTDDTLPEYKDDEIALDDDNVPGQEDDDDFEKVIIEEFDLSLRKYITELNGVDYIGRIPKITVTNLANDTETTAIYEHPKTPVNLQRGDVITYTISVYNEGDVDGYVDEITDHLPPELEYLPEDEVNKKYEWEISEDGRTVTTDYLSKANESTTRENLLTAFDGTALDSHEVQIRCKVKDTAEFGKKLTNIAEITKHEDDSGNVTILDRDSSPDVFTKPTDENLPEYKDAESSKKYVPGQQDDDDFEKVRIVYFDLALRKFITGVNDKEITNREPELSIGKDGNIVYDHTKEPVLVENGNIVTYTLRIYNEGLVAGYANTVTDDLPEGLEFLPENEINKTHRWIMYKEATEGAKDTIEYDGKKYEKTTNVADAKIIQTDYLSKAQEKEDGANLIKAFDKDKGITKDNPDYRDIKIAFKVTEPTTSDRIIINIAEISDDRDENNNPVEDIDSDPANNNEWNEEDDLDKEFIRVKYFDLSLKKWVSKTIVIEDGKETVTNTGHTGNENPEPIVKVDLHRKKLSNVIVKFEFQIKVTNEGEIAGYAKEITDYVPDGLKFDQEDNKGWYIRDNNDRKVGTRLLEDTLLQPGESANVPIILTWINDPNNIGLKTNIAEISEDYNDSNTPDIDSVPDNEKPGEDDIDDAPVMLAIELGKGKTYLMLGTVILSTIAIGIVAIKKYVL